MANTAKGLSLKYGRSIRKGESASGLPASVRVGDLILKERVFVRYPSHNSSASSQERSSVPFLKQKKTPKHLSGSLSRVTATRRLTVSQGRFAYSQVSRLSLSMCDPERTVSMSIRRSEPRPSGMQGISSSPSDMGSTGIDSCKVIEEASPESPADTTKEDTLDSTGHPSPR